MMGTDGGLIQVWARLRRSIFSSKDEPEEAWGC